MADYPAEHWAALGRLVYTTRSELYPDTKRWASVVGRSSRMLLGLERGEPVGRGTLTKVAKALGWPQQFIWDYLEDPTATPPQQHTPEANERRILDISGLDAVDQERLVDLYRRLSGEDTPPGSRRSRPA